MEILKIQCSSNNIDSEKLQELQNQVTSLSGANCQQENLIKQLEQENKQLHRIMEHEAKERNRTSSKEAKGLEDANNE